MKSENTLREMENLFLALSDKTRLRLLNLMRGGEICVFYFTEVTGESQPKVSRHLAYLRNAGIVSARRKGKWIFYKIEKPESPFAAKILQDTMEWLKDQDFMRADYEKLIVIYKSNESFAGYEQEFSSDISAETNISFKKQQQLEIHLL